ncbi:MAG: SDR family oxidoreductase [Bacteroidota bacterium]
MKSILLLGASSDIAMSMAEVYAKKGYNILLAARSANRLRPFSNDLAIRNEIQSYLYEFDALDYGSHDKLIQQLEYIPTITAVVFGYLGDQRVGEEEWSECTKILETNYLAAVSITNNMAKIYERRGEGTIIGISSVAGDRGRQSNYLYGSAKAGFSAYLAGLRNRLFSKGVHVLTVKPGFVATQMTAHLDLPEKLTSSPEKVANTIYKAALKKKNVLYVSSIWLFIMTVIRLIPEPIFKRLKM